MKNIVEIENGSELVVSLRDIAEYSGNSLKSVRRLLTNKAKDFERLGLNVSEDKSILNRLAEIKLNEPQATLLIISLRSNPTVDKFRLNLVTQFYTMKEKLEQIHQKQLLQKDAYIQKLSKNREYAKTRKGNSQTVANIIREYDIQITAHELNELLVQKYMAKREIVEVVQYSSPQMSNGTPIFNVDMVLALLDGKGYDRGIGYSDIHPTLDLY